MKRNRGGMASLSLEDGQRRLTLVSMNVDDVRTHQERTEIVNRIRKLNKDIGCIQETNDAITTKTQHSEYIIYQGKATDDNEDTANVTSNMDHSNRKYKIKREKGGNGNIDKRKPRPIHYKSRTPQ